MKYLLLVTLFLGFFSRSFSISQKEDLLTKNIIQNIDKTPTTYVPIDSIRIEEIGSYYGQNVFQSLLSYRDLKLGKESNFYLKKEDKFVKFPININSANSYLHCIYDDISLYEKINTSNYEHQIIKRDKGKDIVLDTLTYEFPIGYAYNLEEDGKTVVLREFEEGPEEDGNINIYIYKYDGTKIKKHIEEIRNCLNYKYINDSLSYALVLEYEQNISSYQYRFYKITNRGKEIIAMNVNILNWSDDGCFALGKTYLFGKQVLLLLDVKNKKERFLVDVEDSGNYFFDKEKKQFAILSPNMIVYIPLNLTFPFDSTDSFYLEDIGSFPKLWYQISLKLGVKVKIEN